ncbi:MAG: hypothetical protein HYU97_03155 [Deltaproteobacteria bacterium]|nr:hypothetical protein [Deltaproteobacteria bacterium]
MVTISKKIQGLLRSGNIESLRWKESCEKKNDYAPTPLTFETREINCHFPPFTGSSNSNNIPRERELLEKISGFPLGLHYRFYQWSSVELSSENAELTPVQHKSASLEFQTIVPGPKDLPFIIASIHDKNLNGKVEAGEFGLSAVQVGVISPRRLMTITRADSEKFRQQAELNYQSALRAAGLIE